MTYISFVKLHSHFSAHVGDNPFPSERRGDERVDTRAMGGRFQEITVPSFLAQIHQCRLDTLEKIKAHLPKLREELKDEHKLKQIYKFSFTFYRDPESPGKNLGKFLSQLS